MYPMRTSRRSSSSAIVAMTGELGRFCDASAALNEFEATGGSVLARLAGRLFESGLISMLVRERSWGEWRKEGERKVELEVL